MNEPTHREARETTRGKRTENLGFSDAISNFCRIMDSAIKDYGWNYNEVNRMDRLTQDYLHKLELGNLGYKDRAKVATQLAICRKSRRECKDTVEVLESLVGFLESDKGRQLMNLMREALGQTRKAEERMKTRTYRPRVLDERTE